MEDIIKNLIDEIASHKHALALTDRNIRELIALLKDKMNLEREKNF